MLRAALLAADSNKDGRLSCDEFHAAMGSLGVVLSKRDATLIFGGLVPVGKQTLDVAATVEQLQSLQSGAVAFGHLRHQDRDLLLQERSRVQTRILDSLRSTGSNLAATFRQMDTNQVHAPPSSSVATPFLFSLSPLSLPWAPGRMAS